MDKLQILKQSKALLITFSALLMLAATVKVCGCSSDMDECPAEECGSEDKEGASSEE